MAFITQGKTNWKYILIVVILAVIVGGGILGYQRWILEEEIKTPELKIEKTQEPQEIYSIIDEINFIGETSIKDYEIRGAKFKIFPKIYKEETKEYFWGYFEAYDGGEKIYTSEPIYAISNLLVFEYQDNKYIILSDYSGGAHCCFLEHIFILNKNNELKLIKTLPLESAHITRNSLVVKNRKLYLLVKDHRFDYFYAAHADSYFFNQYFLIDDDKLISSNTDFQNDYIEEAKRCENELAEFYQKMKSIEEEEIKTKYYSFESWSPLLICTVVNYILVGEEEKAWGSFEEYFSNFSSISFYLVKGVEPEIIREEIIKKME